MPQVFKTLVEISTWVLFIFACIFFLNTIVLHIIGELSPALTLTMFGTAMVSFFLAAVTARIRHKLE